MQFCKEFNAARSSQGDLIIPVLITVYADRAFTFITKTPPAAILLKKAAGIEKGSGEPNKNKVGKVTQEAGPRHRRAQAPRSQHHEPRVGDAAPSPVRRARWASKSSTDRFSRPSASRLGAHDVSV